MSAYRLCAAPLFNCTHTNTPKNWTGVEAPEAVADLCAACVKNIYAADLRSEDNGTDTSNPAALHWMFGFRQCRGVGFVVIGIKYPTTVCPQHRL